MSRTIKTITNSTWKSIKSRYIIGVGGLALAAGLVLGASVLSTSGAVPQSQPTFANPVDAEDASRALGTRPSSLTVQPMFANAVDAEEAGRGLVQVAELPHPFTGQPMFATEADAEDAARGLFPPQ